MPTLTMLSDVRKEREVCINVFGSLSDESFLELIHSVLLVLPRNHPLPASLNTTSAL